MSSPPVMSLHEKTRLRAAAYRASRVYPGPVGELLSREILVWEEFGFRLGGGGLILRLVDQVLKMPIPPNPNRVSAAAATSAVGYE